MREKKSTVTADHPDYPLLFKLKNELISKMGGVDALEVSFPLMIRQSIDLVIDPVRTGRTHFNQLDNVEKTFIGLKVEHALRDQLDVPKGLRDLVIDGVDVDVKNTVRDTWTIPPETYRNSEPCILIASEDETNRCWLGLIVAKLDYLTKGENRDSKKTVSASGFENILWLLEGVTYPKTPWHDINLERFRELRSVRGGTKRVSMFFRENLEKPIHRSIIEILLFDQKDYMKRVRGNGGARDKLRVENIAVLSGAYDNRVINSLGYGGVASDEFIAIKAATKEQQQLLTSLNLIDE